MNNEWEYVQLMTLDGMKVMCAKLSIDNTGSKEDVFNRLKTYYEVETSKNETSTGLLGVSRSTK